MIHVHFNLNSPFVAEVMFLGIHPTFVSKRRETKSRKIKVVLCHRFLHCISVYNRSLNMLKQAAGTILETTSTHKPSTGALA